ncbi:hypothetical protein DPMN_088361, partial [Dreissena polymorpha]
MKTCRCLFWIGSLCTCLLAVIVGIILHKAYRPDVPAYLLESIGEEGVQVFMAFDRDGDGYLSMDEYEELYLSMLDSKHGQTSLQTKEYTQPISADDEVITLQARFQPIVRESMTRSKQEGIQSDETALPGLMNWTRPFKEWQTFAVQNFLNFFPRENLNVGAVYHLVKDERTFLEKLDGDLSSNRYYPPDVKDEHVILHRLLQMFHPRPFIMSRFKPRGSMAVLRAKSATHLDILFRMHAEFQLNELPHYPLWFTPAQFTGRIIVTRDLRHIEHFNVVVPTSKKLNVDMEWLESGSNMVVDIGFMPEMALQSTSPSVHVSE